MKDIYTDVDGDGYPPVLCIHSYLDITHTKVRLVMVTGKQQNRPLIEVVVDDNDWVPVWGANSNRVKASALK